MPFNQITLSDLAGYKAFSIKGMYDLNEDAVVTDAGYIDTETNLVNNCTYIPRDLITGQDTVFTLKINDISPKYNIETPINLISAIANVQTIIISNLYKKRSQNTQEYDIYSSQLIQLIKSILINNSNLKEGMTLVFDNIYTTHAYDQFATELISFCMTANIPLKYLSLPISTIMYMAMKDFEDHTDTLERIITQVKRNKIQELSINENLVRCTESYQTDYKRDNSKVYSDAFNFIFSLLELEDCPVNILVQEIPPDYSLEKNIELDSVHVEDITLDTGRHIKSISGVLYMEVINPVIQKYSHTKYNLLMQGYSQATSLKKQNIYLFCNIYHLSQLAKAPYILSRWILVNQVDETIVDAAYNIASICVDTTKEAMRHIQIPAIEKTKCYNSVLEVISKIMYYNLFYLRICAISQSSFTYITQNAVKRTCDTPVNNLGFIHIGSFQFETVSNLNYFF